MKLIVRTSRQKRCLEALVNYKTISSLELRKITGALNVYEVVRQLRELGWKIITRNFPIKDQDGILRHPGEYLLDKEHYIIAENYLKKMTAEHPDESSTALTLFLKNNSNNTK